MRTEVADECIRKPEIIDIPGFGESEVIEVITSLSNWKFTQPVSRTWVTMLIKWSL